MHQSLQQRLRQTSVQCVCTLFAVLGYELFLRNGPCFLDPNTSLFLIHVIVNVIHLHTHLKLLYNCSIANLG